jgi:hypothetical protein
MAKPTTAMRQRMMMYSTVERPWVSASKLRTRRVFIMVAVSFV